MIRQILTPATGDEQDAPVFATALAVARHFGAQIEFLHARTNPDDVLVSMAGGDASGGYAMAELMETVAQQAAEGEVRARAACTTFCNEAGLEFGPGGAEFITRIGDAGEAIVAHGRTTDLVVIGRQRVEDEVALALLQTVLMGTGRPLLIAADTPPASPFATLGIAWKSTAEAARAVGAAMPFVEAAGRVVVLTVDETSPSTEDDSLDRLLHALRRHNPAVEALHLQPGEGEAPAEALLAGAVKAGITLLVMGAYGHSRLREALFGGFTQAVLRGAPIPVLMAH